jgi:hypothetical protein
VRGLPLMMLGAVTAALGLLVLGALLLPWR